MPGSSENVTGLSLLPGHLAAVSVLTDRDGPMWTTLVETGSVILDSSFAMEALSELEIALNIVRDSSWPIKGTEHAVRRVLRIQGLSVGIVVAFLKKHLFVQQPVKQTGPKTHTCRTTQAGGLYALCQPEKTRNGG